MFILVCAGAGQFDYIDSLHLPGHSVTTAMLRDTVTSMLFALHRICNKTGNVHITPRPSLVAIFAVGKQ